MDPARREATRRLAQASLRGAIGPLCERRPVSKVKLHSGHSDHHLLDRRRHSDLRWPGEEFTAGATSRIRQHFRSCLAGLQTFLRFSERAAQHATAGDWFSAIRRDIEQMLHLPANCRGKAKECLDEVRKEMNRASQDAPELNSRLWMRQAQRFGVKEPMQPT